MTELTEKQELAQALMKAYTVFQQHLKECPFCGSAIDLDCYHDCPMQLAEQISLDID